MVGQEPELLARSLGGPEWISMGIRPTYLYHTLAGYWLVAPGSEDDRRTVSAGQCRLDPNVHWEMTRLPSGVPVFPAITVRGQVPGGLHPLYRCPISSTSRPAASLLFCRWIHLIRHSKMLILILIYTPFSFRSDLGAGAVSLVEGLQGERAAMAEAENHQARPTPIRLLFFLHTILSLSRTVFREVLL